MRDIDFGSSTYKAPPNPADYPFVYLMANERHTVEKLGKLSLPFEPYMVNSGCVYAISSPILTEPLVQIASIVLSVNDRKVLHCDKAFWSTIDKVPVTVCYDAVFDLLRRNGIYHVPPSFEMSVAMLDAMRAQGLVEPLFCPGFDRFKVVLYRAKVEQIDHGGDLIVAALKRNGELGTRELAERTGLTISQVRSRVNALIAQGELEPTAPATSRNRKYRLSERVG